MNPSHTPLPIIATGALGGLTLVASAFGSVFIYNMISPFSVILALIMAFAIIFLNFAEGYMVRFAIAAWRFGFQKLALLVGLLVIPISLYSLWAGFNVIESFIAQNQKAALASDYDIAAAQDRIRAARSTALSSDSFADAQANYMNTSAAEKEKIAALLREKPTSNSSASPQTTASIVAIALEAAIIGLAAFLELFLRPTPLPALVKFADKMVSWGLNEDYLHNLDISASPAPGTVSLPGRESPPERVRTRAGAVEEVEIVMVEEEFQAWSQKLLKGEIRPTVKATKQHLRQQGQSMEVAQATAAEYLERGYNLGYLDLNDSKSVASSQYKLATPKLLGQGASYAS